jgi:hypothetical protein
MVTDQQNKGRALVDAFEKAVIVFLKGECEDQESSRPLYTKEEKRALYGIKKDIERYPRRSQ